MLIQILFWVFCLCVALQIAYDVFFLVSGPKPFVAEQTSFTPVSVIICAKNEAANLRLNLPSILTQRYRNDAGKPLYEVIVVNDASTDDTAAVLEDIKSKYDHLRIITIGANEQRNLPGKKYALNKGVNAATHQHLLFTDADCMPAGDDWLRLMTAPLAAGKQIVVGYGKYRQAGSILNAFVRWETIHTFLQYSSYTLAGKPYMAVGRNLACNKGIWLSAEKAHIWSQLPSGDDDLLMQTMATGDNTVIIADPAAFTLTDAKTTWSSWARQKQRHMSTGKYYRPDIKALLSIYASSHAAMWLSFTVLLFMFNPVIVGDIIAVRFFIYGIGFSWRANKLQEKDLTPYLLLFDFGWMLYNFALSPYIIWKNKKQWT